MSVKPAALRPSRLVALALALALSLVLSGTTSASAARSSTAQSTAAAEPSFGLLGPTDSQLPAIAGSRITRVSLSAGWDQLEPSANVYNGTLLTQLASQLASLRSQGFQVVLDLGLQYPPSWVFGLPGATHFIDQYGDVWSGPLSTNVPNAVFDTAVRSAEASYIARVASALGPGNLASVRVGGLLSGELRYPPNTYNGHQDLLWDYDATAQANAPVRGWKPGSGTSAQIQSSLTYYFTSLTSYETWLMKTIATSFPGVDQQVMLPGWGLRPGMVDDVVSSGMHNTTVAEVNGLISAGLDWANQVKAISTAGIKATVYTTWLDAPAQSSTVQGIAPVDFLTTLAGQYALPIAGENTGGGGTDALITDVQRAQADHLTSVMYMSGDLVANGSAGVSIDNLLAAAAYLSP